MMWILVVLSALAGFASGAWAGYAKRSAKLDMEYSRRATLAARTRAANKEAASVAMNAHWDRELPAPEADAAYARTVEAMASAPARDVPDADGGM